MLKPWMQSEVKFLRENTCMNALELAESLGRTKPSIFSMCRKLGITVTSQTKIELSTLDGLDSKAITLLLDIANIRTSKTRLGVVDCVINKISSEESALKHSASKMCINRATNRILYTNSMINIFNERGDHDKAAKS